MSNETRKAVITLPLSGDDAYMNRLNNLTVEERKIIEKRIPVPLDQADDIIKKVLDCRTLPDDDFMKDIRQILCENRDVYKMLAKM